MIFKGNRSGKTMNFTTQVSPGYKFINRFEGGVHWYMMEAKDVISSICCKLKKKITNSFHSTVNQYRSDHQSRKFDFQHIKWQEH